jgi:hypothetical protein
LLPKVSFVPGGEFVVDCSGIFSRLLGPTTPKTNCDSCLRRTTLFCLSLRPGTWGAATDHEAGTLFRKWRVPPKKISGLLERFSPLPVADLKTNQRL